MLRMVVHQMGVDAPGPALRVTLRSWIASVETAGLDWLEHRDMERAELERLLVDQMVALLRAASGHDPGMRVLLETLLPVHAAPENAAPENAAPANAAPANCEAVP
ncbi:hypothetical protein GCM10027612_00620 [Microbispora bryophytorum subsp. camponoti]